MKKMKLTWAAGLLHCETQLGEYPWRRAYCEPHEATESEAVLVAAQYRREGWAVTLVR